MPKTNNIRFHLIAALVVITWGTTFISTKFLLYEGLAPEDIFFYRFLMAYIGIWCFETKRLFAENLKDEMLLLLLGIFGGSIYFATENYALKVTLASNVALIVCTAPILTAILTHFILKTERITRNLIRGSLVALIGVSLVVFNGNFILQISPLGDFLSISAALSWAFYTIILKRVEGKYSTLFITRKIFFYGLLTILPAFLIKPLTFNVNMLSQPVVFGNLLYLGFVASLTCFFLWNTVVKKLGAIRATNYIYFSPIVTLIASSIALPEEKITLIALGGAVLILSGVILSEKKGLKV